MLRFYGINRPVSERAGRVVKVCYVVSSAGAHDLPNIRDHQSLGGNAVVLDWGTTKAGNAPEVARPGAAELAKGLCLAALGAERAGDPSFARALAVYKMFQHRVVNKLPDTMGDQSFPDLAWSMTEADIRLEIEQIEQDRTASAREVADAIAREPKDKLVVAAETGIGVGGGQIVWTRDDNGNLIDDSEIGPHRR